MLSVTRHHRDHQTSQLDNGSPPLLVAMGWHWKSLGWIFRGCASETFRVDCSGVSHTSLLRQRPEKKIDLQVFAMQPRKINRKTTNYRQVVVMIHKNSKSGNVSGDALPRTERWYLLVWGRGKHPLLLPNSNKIMTCREIITPMSRGLDDSIAHK